MRRLAFFLGICAFLAAAPGAFGQAKAKTYYIFASSNRTSGMSDEAAAKKLDSDEQNNIVAIDDEVACALTRKVAISGVVGVYDKTSANSFLTKIELEPEQMEYLGSLLGLYAHQRYVLAFTAQKGGMDRLWIINTAKNLNDVAAAVRQQHMTPLSVRVEKLGTQLWIVDLGNKFGERPKELAAQLGGKASEQEGSAQIVGNEKDRASAEATYNHTIQSFEQQSKLRFSAAVTGAAWPNASKRSCSVELPE